MYVDEYVDECAGEWVDECVDDGVHTGVLIHRHSGQMRAKIIPLCLFFFFFKGALFKSGTTDDDVSTNKTKQSASAMYIAEHSMSFVGG